MDTNIASAPEVFVKDLLEYPTDRLASDATTTVLSEDMNTVDHLDEGFHIGVIVTGKVRKDTVRVGWTAVQSVVDAMDQ